MKQISYKVINKLICALLIEILEKDSYCLILQDGVMQQNRKGCPALTSDWKSKRIVDNKSLSSPAEFSEMIPSIFLSMEFTAHPMSIPELSDR